MSVIRRDITSKIIVREKCLESFKKKSNEKAIVALEEESDSDAIDILVVTEKQLIDKWIQNFGCSFHMYPNKDFFKTFDGVVKDLNQVRYVLDVKRNLISL